MGILSGNIKAGRENRSIRLLNEFIKLADVLLLYMCEECSNGFMFRKVIEYIRAATKLSTNIVLQFCAECFVLIEH